MTKNTVIFSHGKESGPFGSKIKFLDDVAKSMGFNTLSVDYRDLDNPDLRVDRLLDIVKQIQGPIILVG